MDWIYMTLAFQCEGTASQQMMIYTNPKMNALTQLKYVYFNKELQSIKPLLSCKDLTSHPFGDTASCPYSLVFMVV